MSERMIVYFAGQRLRLVRDGGMAARVGHLATVTESCFSGDDCVDVKWDSGTTQRDGDYRVEIFAPLPAERLSGKVVCDELSEPHEPGAGAGGKSCVKPRPAQPQAPGYTASLPEHLTISSAFGHAQAPAPSLDARAMLLEGALVRLLETQSVSFSDEQAAAIDYACDEVLRRRIEPKEGHRRSVDAPCSEGTPEPSDALRETWIKGCLAGREEAADICDMMADATPPHNETRRLQASNCAHEIRSLPAPTAPKEPQR